MAIDDELTLPVGSVSHDIWLLLVGSITSRIVGFLFIPLYAAFLSPSQYGVVELIELSCQTLVFSFGLQGFGMALSRVFYDQPRADRQRAIASAAVIGTVALSVVVAVVAIVFANQISVLIFQTEDWAHLLRFAFAGLCFSSIAEVMLVKERMERHARFFLSYTLVQLAATLALNIVFIALLGLGVWGFILSRILVSMVGAGVLLVRHGRTSGWRGQLGDLAGLVAVGAPLAVAGAAYFAIQFSDRFVLNANVSLADIGRYAVAGKFAILVSALVGDSLGKTWETRLYQTLSRPDWRQEFARFASYLTSALLVAGLAVVMFAPELLRIMVPRAFYPPPMLLPLLVAAFLMREIGDFFRSLLLINRSTSRVRWIALGCAMLNVAANLVLVPLYGVYGAGFAAAGTWFVYMVVCWTMANHEHGLPMRTGAYVRLGMLLVAAYLLSRDTRVEAFTPDLLLDVFWVVMFGVLTVGTFLTSEERRGAVRMVGAVVLWGFMRTTLAGNAGRSFGANAAGSAVGPRRGAGGGAATHLLMLSYYFPPQNEIGAVRPERFARWLSRYGIDVTVVTSAPPRTRAGDEPQVDTVHVPGMSLAGLNASRWDTIPPALGVRVAAAAIHLGERLLLPYDDRMGWLPFAYVAASRRVGPDTVLFSTHPPTVTHLTALALKHRFGLPWIADFRDPLWGNPYRTSQRAALIDPTVERLTVENADAVIANTEAAAAVLRARYPALADKVQVIWNGFDPEEKIPCVPRTYRTRRVLAHTGTLYGNRTLLPVMLSLNRLIERGSLDPATIQLRQVGRVDPACHDPGHPAAAALARLGCIHVIGQSIPKADALQEMLSAEWLLVLDINLLNPGLQVPAKIYEYVRTGRPILAITVPGSSTERLLAMSGAVHACIHLNADPEEIDAALLSFIEAPDRPYTLTASFQETFGAPSQVNQLMDVIERAKARQAAANWTMAEGLVNDWGD
jgi:O-antigen/teichoic acid export membrane protein/glycosyltransferase involved in cell wall biosynthesis